MPSHRIIHGKRTSRKPATASAGPFLVWPDGAVGAFFGIVVALAFASPCLSLFIGGQADFFACGSVIASMNLFTLFIPGMLTGDPRWVVGCGVVTVVFWCTLAGMLAGALWRSIFHTVSQSGRSGQKSRV